MLKKGKKLENSKGREDISKIFSSSSSRFRRDKVICSRSRFLKKYANALCNFNWYIIAIYIHKYINNYNGIITEYWWFKTFDLISYVLLENTFMKCKFSGSPLCRFMYIICTSPLEVLNLFKHFEYINIIKEAIWKYRLHLRNANSEPRKFSV